MAHKIGTRDIQTGIYMAWHGLTNVISEITRENSGIAYGMTIKPTYIFDDDNNPIELPSRQIVSLDDYLPIGLTVGKDYSLISNSDVWNLVDKSLFGMTHKVVSCGTVLNRAIGFISVELDKEFTAAGRITESTLNFTWGHGGKMGLIAKTGFVTQVCANTVRMNLAEHSEFKCKVRHTKNADQQIENITKVVNAHFGMTAKYKQGMDELANINISETDAEQLFAGLIAPKDETELSSNGRNRVNRLVELFHIGAGNNGDGLDDAYNAITDFYSHESSGGDNRWKQYVSSDFGVGNKMKEESFYTLLDSTKRNNAIKRGESLLLASAN